MQLSQRCLASFNQYTLLSCSLFSFVSFSRCNCDSQLLLCYNSHVNTCTIPLQSFPQLKCWRQWGDLCLGQFLLLYICNLHGTIHSVAGLVHPPPINTHMHRLVTASSKVQLLVQSQVTLFSTSYGSATFDLQQLVARHGGNCKSACVVHINVGSECCCTVNVELYLL